VASATGGGRLQATCLRIGWGDAVAQCNASETPPSWNQLRLLRTRRRVREGRRGEETLPGAGSESRQMLAVYPDDSGIHPAVKETGKSQLYGNRRPHPKGCKRRSSRLY